MRSNFRHQVNIIYAKLAQKIFNESSFFSNAQSYENYAILNYSNYIEEHFDVAKSMLEKKTSF